MNNIKLAKKPIESYPKPIIDSINLITSKGFPDILPVGSYIYKIVGKYPADIDLMEIITKKDISLINREIKKIINKIKKAKNTYIGDIKIGADLLFDIDIGKIKNNKIVGYNYKKIKKYVDEIIKKYKLNTNILPLIKKKPTIIRWNKLKNEIHNLRTLRWTPKEIKQGFKKLIGNREISLNDALSMPEIIKIDIWKWLDNLQKYEEITNLIKLNILGKKATKKMNLKIPDYIPEIKKEIQKYMDPYNYSPFKVLKRMFSLAILFKDHKTINKIVSSSGRST